MKSKFVRRTGKVSSFQFIQRGFLAWTSVFFAFTLSDDADLFAGKFLVLFARLNFFFPPHRSTPDDDQAANFNNPDTKLQLFVKK